MFKKLVRPVIADGVLFVRMVGVAAAFGLIIVAVHATKLVLRPK